MPNTHIVYVPREGAAHGIADASAIVAAVDADATDLVKVYYEGNLYKAENLKDFEDRVRIAAGRQADRAPTVAFRWFPRTELREVGRYDHDVGRVTTLSEADALKAWLGDEQGWVDDFIPW